MNLRQSGRDVRYRKNISIENTGTHTGETRERV